MASGQRILTTDSIAEASDNFPGGGGFRAHLIRRFFGPTRVHTPNGISIGSIVLAQFMSMSNRQTQTHTDHGTSVTIGRIFTLC